MGKSFESYFWMHLNLAASPEKMDIFRGNFYWKWRYQAAIKIIKQKVWEKQCRIQKNYGTYLQNPKYLCLLCSLWKQTFITQRSFWITRSQTKKFIIIFRLKTFHFLKVLFPFWWWSSINFRFIWSRSSATPYVKTFW